MQTFWNWWQHLPENIDPVIFSLGNFKLQYYGLMYMVAFGITYALVIYRVKREERFDLSTEQIQSLTTWMMLGVIIGGRLGYVVFYQFSYFLKNPLEIILPFKFSGGFTFTGITGMSYHGGLIVVILFTWMYARKNDIRFNDITDLYIPAIPLGYTFGRLGNFINGELYGRVTDSAIGMYFPLAQHVTGKYELRHPSQLYEAFFEGIFLFIILWSIKKMTQTKGALFDFFLIGYGSVRFIIEYFRQPDDHIGFVLLSFSMGQILCMMMIIGGISHYIYLKKRSAQQKS